MRSVRIILDTSAYSHFRNSHQKVAHFIKTAEQVYIPMPVLGELEAAFQMGSRRNENLLLLNEFLEQAFVGVIDVTVEVARRYGEIFAFLRKAGTPIPTNDVWIAACALVQGGHLLTFDRDFGRIPFLDCSIFKPID